LRVIYFNYMADNVWDEAAGGMIAQSQGVKESA
jgi:hypothetical protein